MSIRDTEYTPDELDWLWEKATMFVSESDRAPGDYDSRGGRADVGNWFWKGDTPPELVLGVRAAVDKGLSVEDAQSAVMAGWCAAREESGN